MLNATPLEQKIAALVEPIVLDMGLSLFSVNVIGDGASRSLQVMAEDPATKRLDLGACTKLSKAISTVLDVEDPIQGAYKLEVSSPGIDRLLLSLEQFQEYKGFEAKIELNVPIESGQKRFRGIIQEVKENNIGIETDQGLFEIPFKSLKKAKLVLTDELIKATAINT